MFYDQFLCVPKINSWKSLSHVHADGISPIIYNSKTADGSTFFVQNELRENVGKALRAPCDVECTLIRMHRWCIELRSATQAERKKVVKRR